MSTVETELRQPPKRFRAKVVGVSFCDGSKGTPYPDNLYRLEAAYAEHMLKDTPERVPALLIRNPANEHDANAIEVHVPSVGMIGHVARDLAARLAPCLDAGERWQAQVGQVLINPDHPDRPGILIDVKKVEVAEG